MQTQNRQSMTSCGNAWQAQMTRLSIVVISLSFLLILMLLTLPHTVLAQTGMDPRCEGLTGQAMGLCTAAVSEGCFDGVESDECNDLTTNWMEDCRVCAGINPPWVGLGCGAVGSCRVFVTSRGYTGDFVGEAQTWHPATCVDVSSSLDAADCICQAHADDGNLGGSYKAWLSTSTSNAITRVTQTMVQYVRVDGELIASDVMDLTDGTISVPINITEFPEDLANNVVVWTGTNPSGTLATPTCDNWAYDGPAPPAG